MLSDPYLEITSEGKQEIYVQTWYLILQMLTYAPSFLQVRISAGREREVPLMGEVMAGLPHVKCGYSRVVHPPQGSLEAPVER